MAGDTEDFSTDSDVYVSADSDAPFVRSRIWRWGEVILQGPDWQTKMVGSTMKASWTENEISGPFSLIFESHIESPVRRDERWHEIEAKDVGLRFLFLEEHGGQVMEKTNFGFDRVCGHYYLNIQKDYDVGSHLIYKTDKLKMRGSFRTRVTWC